jgi:c-di-GMP-binding flagellar brake protein YcgR
MKERRKYRRVKVGVKLVYKLLGIKGEVTLPTADLGGGGIRLFVNKKVKTGTIVELGLILPHEEQIFFSLGEVVWQVRDVTRIQRGEDFYETGVKFLNLGLAHRMRLIRFIHDKIKEGKDEV